MSERAPALVTAADISRLAGVTRATVSNWRRRHADFPAPVGGTDTSPAYDLDAVRTWLSARGQLPEHSPADELRIMLRALPETGRTVIRLFAVVLVAATIGREELESLPRLPDDALVSWARSAVETLTDEIPGAGEDPPGTLEAGLLRALIRQVLAEGGQAAADVLSERLLEDSNVAGTYLTPVSLIRLMTELLVDESGGFPETVLDPACGSGSFLAAAAAAGATSLYGQDVVAAQAAQAAVRLRLSAPDAAVTVRAGDSLRCDAFPELTVDGVLCNPPYGDRAWGHDELAYDQRWAYGVPPKGEPELAWVQHCLSHLAPGSRAVLVMPPAVAERASGRSIRTQLIRDGAVLAIIALPQGAATPLHIGLHIWIVQRPEPTTEVPATVLFVDTSTASSKHGVDWATIEKTVLNAWHAHCAGTDLVDISAARVLPLIDLLDQTVDLTPVRHVRGARIPTNPLDSARQAAEVHDRLHRSVTEVGDLCQSGGEWRPAGDRPRAWRTATVADLLRGGAVELLHTTPIRRTRSEHSEPSPAPRHGERTVLTAEDVVKGQAASGTYVDIETAAAVHLLRRGDVLLPEIFRAGNPTLARVADADDADCALGPHLWLFRPDPQRLDPWFLAGFLAEEENVSAATTGTSIVRVDPRRLRVPLLPLTEQRRYGDAFRHLHAIRATARRTARAADEATRVLSAGLTGGTLLPPGHESP
ncbi:N-6 DNA methylase [Actinoallomurus acanthiterrae]